LSLEFLSPGPEALARSPMEREARAAGARIEARDGWHVALAFGTPEEERARCHDTVGFADVSHLGKIEIQADAADLSAMAPEELELGKAVRAAENGFRSHPAEPGAHGENAFRSHPAEPGAHGLWWCPYSAERALVLCDPGAVAGLRERLTEAADACAGPVSLIDVTTAYAALTIVGPLARELFARFTAVDLRPQVMPVEGFRPGSVARVPGAILREAEDRFLMLFGAALGRYMWTVVHDAAAHLGGGPVGTQALRPIDEPLEAAPRA